MIKKLLSIFKNGVFLIAFFGIISGLLGFFRERLLATTFGAGELLDSYYAAFRLPDFIFNTLIFGAVGSAFIPQFVRAWSKEKNQAIYLANNLTNVLTLVMIMLFILFWLAAPFIIPIIAPGFDLPSQILTISLTRIMLVSIVFFCLSTILSSILNSLHKYFFYSLAPIFYNFGIIIGIIFIVPSYGIKGAAWGVVIGSILHFSIQLLACLKSHWHYQLVFNFDWQIKKIFKLMLPRSFGLLINQINQIFITIFASYLKTGSLTIYNLANNIQFVPINMIGISIATVVFPHLSRFWINNEQENFKEKLHQSIKQILFFTLPLSFALIIFSQEIVYLLCGLGKFSELAIAITVKVLIFFSISIFAQSLLPIITKAFYAQEDTITPVKISIVSIIINIILSLILMRFWGIVGLAVSFSVSAIINLLILYIILKNKLKIKYSFDLLKYFILVCFVSLISFGQGKSIINILNNLVSSQNYFNKLFILFVAFIFCLILLYWLLIIFKIKEIYLLKKYLLLKNDKHGKN